MVNCEKQESCSGKDAGLDQGRRKRREVDGAAVAAFGVVPFASHTRAVPIGGARSMGAGREESRPEAFVFCLSGGFVPWSRVASVVAFLAGLSDRVGIVVVARRLGQQVQHLVRRHRMGRGLQDFVVQHYG